MKNLGGITGRSGRILPSELRTVYGSLRDRTSYCFTLRACHTRSTVYLAIRMSKDKNHMRNGDIIYDIDRRIGTFQGKKAFAEKLLNEKREDFTDGTSCAFSDIYHAKCACFISMSISEECWSRK